MASVILNVAIGATQFFLNLPVSIAGWRALWTRLALERSFDIWKESRDSGEAMIWNEVAALEVGDTSFIAVGNVIAISAIEIGNTHIFGNH